MNKTRIINPAIWGFVVVALMLSMFGSTCTVARAESTTAPRPRPKGKAPWWNKFNAINKAVQERQDFELLFIGDSITHYWERDEGGRIDTWKHYYGHRKALNLGVQGDRTQNVLWRLDNGNIEGLSPKVVVLLIGTNNVRDKPERIVAGITAIIEKLRARMPEAKILLLEIFPAGKPDNPRRQVASAASEAVSQLADGKIIHFLNLNHHFLDADGNLIGFTDEDGKIDYVHLSGEGYRIWAKAMEPKLAELLGDKPVAAP